MFILQVMVTGGKTMFPKRYSWAFNVSGTATTMFMVACQYMMYGNGGTNGIDCRMVTPGGYFQIDPSGSSISITAAPLIAADRQRRVTARRW